MKIIERYFVDYLAACPPERRDTLYSLLEEYCSGGDDLPLEDFFRKLPPPSNKLLKKLGTAFFEDEKNIKRCYWPP